MSRYNDLETMLVVVAQALGEDLLQQVVFVGGCTTGLLITDSITQEAIRYTEDVDLITHVIGYSQWATFQEQLKEKGFTINPKDDVICRMRLGDLKVDFMPDDERILGFSNRWYHDALEQAKYTTLNDGNRIRLICPCHFVATKLEAYLGRGNGDPLSSHDIEDILNLVDGRTELVEEMTQASTALKTYIAETIEALLSHSDFDYAIQAAANNSPGREAIIVGRLEALTQLRKP
ncbi:MAG: putative nucleotidyltransferase [Pseudohongiellaceae bacterium]|jgi:predicted nucleotidyltransferase